MDIGQTLPATPVQQFRDGEILQIDLAAESAGKTIVLVTLPGAFTPTCSDSHVPGFVAEAEALAAKGVDKVFVLAPNDFFVVAAWAETKSAPALIDFVADGNQDFTRAAGLELDLSEIGLGLRAQRTATIVKDGKVTWHAIEADPTGVDASGADKVLGAL